ncbi:unnamed protein product [Polarella glacialis]|uniref:Uncharacterized protein n=1 Tax=Polarella glacialis TaxID=89957 RepID=A0A813JW30_POLGL|nr:unnamed protein product [Polarella glacialis]
MCRQQLQYNNDNNNSSTLKCPFPRRPMATHARDILNNAMHESQQYLQRNFPVDVPACIVTGQAFRTGTAAALNNNNNNNNVHFHVHSYALLCLIGLGKARASAAASCS